MIDYGQVIHQIRTVIPDVLGTVAGAASIDNLDVSSNPVLPAAYVVPLAFNTDPSTLLGGALKQNATETFGVVVMQRSGDLRGQTGANTMPAIRQALWRALLNWRPESILTHTVRGIEYVDDSVIEGMSTTGRVFWLFKYRVDLQISHEDGFIPVYPPLSEIDITDDAGDLLSIENLDAPQTP